MNAVTKYSRSTPEQQRAKDAWDRTQGCRDDYVKLAKGLPALITNSGLMQVMAYLKEKGSDKNGREDPADPHTQIATHLRAWLHARFPQVPESFEGFMEALLKAGPRDYQAITAEAFAWLKWLRQMAAARRG